MPQDHTDQAHIYGGPISYLQRSRRYYQTQGFGDPYRWAHHDTVPFAPLRKPLAEARVALVTTAARYDPALGDQGPWAAYNADAKFMRVYSLPSDADHDLRISHIGYDRQHTSAEDPNSYLPLPALRAAAAEGRVGGLTARLAAAPTTRSQRQTNEVDAPEILRLLREDGADAAMLVPV